MVAERNVAGPTMPVLHRPWHETHCTCRGKGFDDRVRPDWCPPGPVFGIVWSSIALLRATSALLVWDSCGQNLLAVPLVLFAIHLVRSPPSL